MKFTININTENSAYEDNMQLELIENLHQIIEKLSNNEKQGWVFDTNGNRTGHYRFVNNVAELSTFGIQ